MLDPWNVASWEYSCWSSFESNSRKKMIGKRRVFTLALVEHLRWSLLITCRWNSSSRIYPMDSDLRSTTKANCSRPSPVAAALLLVESPRSFPIGRSSLFSTVNSSVDRWCRSICRSVPKSVDPIEWNNDDKRTPTNQIRKNDISGVCSLEWFI